MKKLLLILLALMTVITFAACKEETTKVTTIEVSNYAELMKAVEDIKGETTVMTIKLTADIEENPDFTNNVADAVGELQFRSDTGSLNFVLDLNGKTINTAIDLIAGKNWDHDNDASTPTRMESYGNKFHIVIKNGTIESNDEDIYYGIGVYHAYDEDVKVTMDNIDVSAYYGGLYTNGTLEGATVIGKDSSFTGLYASDCLGAYLPAQFEYSFTDCTFTGDNGYYTKSGTHILENCTFIGQLPIYNSPTYHGSGAIVNGSAFVMDSAQGYKQPMSVEIIGGTFESEDGYGIEAAVTNSASGTPVTNYGTMSITGTPTFGGNTSKDDKNFTGDVWPVV